MVLQFCEENSGCEDDFGLLKLFDAESYFQLRMKAEIEQFQEPLTAKYLNYLLKS